MEPLTRDTLRTLARAQGLDLSADDLTSLLPLVTGSRELMATLDEVIRPEVEPASEYRIR